MSFNSSPSEPAQGVVSITPSDTVDITGTIRSFEVTVAGNVAVLMPDGSTAVLPNRIAGVMYSIAAKRILSTGTIATGIIGYR